LLTDIRKSITSVGRSEGFARFPFKNNFERKASTELWWNHADREKISVELEAHLNLAIYKRLFLTSASPVLKPSRSY
jgi:hypothetical protein